MKYCAVICELNPFHNGHEYILRRARETSGCDKVIALMSGPFVQRAVPASLSERARAECALRCGADMVIELPVVYASASADAFARGAIGILNTISDITHLVMGAESDDFQLLWRIAKVRAENGEAFSSALKRALDGGIPYARALTRAICTALGEDEEETAALLTRPNNILAISYAQALIESGSGIKFSPVRRAEGDEYASATSLRAAALPDMKKFMPPSAYEIFVSEAAEGMLRDYGLLTMAALRIVGAEKIALAPDCAEGFENKLASLFRTCPDFETLLKKVPTSRFTRGRIMRICLHSLLGITREMQNCGYSCSRLLGVRRDSVDMLRTLPENIIVGKRGERAIPESHLACYAAEKRASDVWNALARKRCDFYSELLKV